MFENQSEVTDTLKCVYIRNLHKYVYEHMKMKKLTLTQGLYKQKWRVYTRVLRRKFLSVVYSSVFISLRKLKFKEKLTASM